MSDAPAPADTPPTPTQAAAPDPLAPSQDSGVVRWVRRVRARPGTALLAVFGVVAAVDYFLDLAVLVGFALGGDVVWFGVSLVATLLCVPVLLVVGLRSSAQIEACKWSPNPTTNGAISVGLTLVHAHVLALALRALAVVRDADLKKIQGTVTILVAKRGLSSSLMLALQVYVLENHASTLLWVSSAFSLLVVGVAVVAHFSEGDRMGLRAWKLVYCLSQIVLRVGLASVLCTSVKSVAFAALVPMLLISWWFAGATFQDNGSQSFLSSYGNGLFYSPLVMLVAVRPSFDSWHNPPFHDPLVTKFLAWRLVENALLAVWLFVLDLVRVDGTLLSVGWLVGLLVVFSALTVLARVLLERASSLAHQELADEL